MTETKHQPIYQLRFQFARENIAAFVVKPRELADWEKLWWFAYEIARESIEENGEVKS